MGRRPNGTSSIYEGSDGWWHGRVTVGVKDDGTPDRRHVRGRSEKEVIQKVTKLERARDDGKVKRPGKAWTVERWLTHWLEHIAIPNVSEYAGDGYRVDVKVHLVPGLGAHRLDKLQPEHLEKFYAKMQAAGSKPATAHHVHRTIRTALNEAVRRGHLTANVAKMAKPPRLDDEEIEPYSVEEIQSLMLEAEKRPNGARWAIALALGLRQGEALGLKWSDVDLEAGVIRVRRSRLRPKYVHGCGDTCGKPKAGYCPQKKPARRETKDTKSRAGRRSVGVPQPVVKLLLAHREQQELARAAARQLWHEGDWVFTDELGRPINPRTDYSEWKRLLTAAGVRDGRLHDARHTAATVLLILGVAERGAMGTMGWSSSSMTTRYQHLVDPVIKDIAERIEGLLWAPPKPDPNPPDRQVEDPAENPN